MQPVRRLFLPLALGLLACSETGTEPGDPPPGGGPVVKAGIDLAVISVQSPASGTAGAKIDVSYTLKNFGTQQGGGFLQVNIGHESLAPSLFPQATATFPSLVMLQPGESQDGTKSLTVP